MAVRLRLMRGGRRNRAFFRIVAIDSHVKQKGRFIELVGWYDPIKPDKNFNVKTDVAEKWIKLGARPTDTVRWILQQSGVEIPARKRRSDKRRRRKGTEESS